MTRAATIALLNAHCQTLSAVETELDLEATRKKAQQEVRRLTDLKDWCEQGEIAKYKAEYANACRVLQIVEAFQHILRDYREGIA